MVTTFREEQKQFFCSKEKFGPTTLASTLLINSVSSAKSTNKFPMFYLDSPFLKMSSSFLP